MPLKNLVVRKNRKHNALRYHYIIISLSSRKGINRATGTPENRHKKSHFNLTIVPVS